MTDEQTLAAERRAEAVRRRGDRPQQRRSAERSTSTRGWTAGLATSMEIRSSSAREGFHEFTGVASVYDRAYEMYDSFGPYEEYVAYGAGAVSLSRADLSVPLVVDHEPIRRLALTTLGTLDVWEAPEGLNVRADLDPSDPDVAYVVPKVRSGLLPEMSFRFFIEDGEWSEDFSTYAIKRYDIHRGDVSIVAYGANPYTSGQVRATDHMGRVRRALLLDALRSA